MIDSDYRILKSTTAGPGYEGHILESLISK
jgi:hypothetical protein